MTVRRACIPGAALCLSLVGLVACPGGGGEPAAQTWQDGFAPPAEGWLMDVAASADGERWWAVGGTPQQGAILDSAQGFAEVTLPEGVPLVNWVHPLSAESAIAVGNAGVILELRDGQWQRMTSPTENDLWGVWAAAADDVWAVGGAGREPGQATLLHYDGVVWTDVPLPELMRPQVWALFKVWGSAADDVYVVGQRGAVLHFDGTAWQELLVGTGEDLVAVWGTSADRVALVGGRSNGVLVTWDGSDWQLYELAPLPGLTGVWMGDPQTVHVSGIQGTLAEVQFDSGEYAEFHQDTRSAFHAVHGSGTRLVAVGGNLDASGPPYEGITRERTIP